MSEYDNNKPSCCNSEMDRDYSNYPAMVVINRDALMAGGVKSPIDDKVYYDRKSYEEHAKRHDCVLVGNDFASKRQKRLEKRAAKKAAAEKAAKGNLITI